MKYRVRHKPTGKWLWHQRCGHSPLCRLVPDELAPNLNPTEWQNQDEAYQALVSTPFGMQNMEVVEWKNTEL